MMVRIRPSFLFSFHKDRTKKHNDKINFVIQLVNRPRLIKKRSVSSEYAGALDAVMNRPYSLRETVAIPDSFMPTVSSSRFFIKQTYIIFYKWVELVNSL